MVCKLQKVFAEYNLKFSEQKTKVLTFIGNEQKRNNIAQENQLLE